MPGWMKILRILRLWPKNVLQGLRRLGPLGGGASLQNQDIRSQAVVAQIRGVGNWGVQRGNQARLLERGSSFNEESGK